MKAAPILTSFNGGEFSPSLEGRTDLGRYSNGCKLLENFLPMVQGPAQRRGGSRFVLPVKDSAKRAWLLKFEFSATQAFQLEFGDLYVRFYTQHGVLLNLGVPYEIVSPYALADLTNADGTCALKAVQSGDVLYIANMKRTYAPRTLTRFGNTDWRFALYEPTGGPFLDQNVDKTNAVYASAQLGSVTLNSIKPLFAATDVGRLIRLDSQNYSIRPWETSVNYNAGDLVRSQGKTYKAANTATSGTNIPNHEFGTSYDGRHGVQWEYQDAGYGIAKITAFTSTTEVTATVLSRLPAGVVSSTKAITLVTQANPAEIVAADHGFATGDSVIVTGVGGMTQLNGRAYIITVLTDGAFTLDGIDSTGFSAFTSGGSVIGNTTTRFQLGAWSATTEYPATVAFWKARLWWGGKQWVWGTVPADFNDMSADFAGLVRADNAIWWPLQSEDVNDILWLVGADKLVVGTGGGEFVGSEITAADALGPGNFQLVRQSKRRCRAVQPVIVNTSVCFVQRAGRKLLALDYSIYIDKYAATDLAVLAERMTRSGIVDMAYQGEPNSTIWCLLANGKLLGFIYEKDQDVIGWHRHPIGGNGFVESICVVPSPDGGREELWMIVRRTIGGETKRYVEYMERPWEGEDQDGTPGDAQQNAFYVDCGLTYEGPPATDISGLDHLEGETVQVLADGAVHPARTVVAGSITLQRAASVAQIGLRAPARLVTMRIEAGAQDGTAQGKTKRVHSATVRFVDSLGGKAGMHGGRLDDISLRNPATPMGSAPPIASGDIKVDLAGDYESDCRIEILQDQPLPMTVAAIMPRMRTYDP